MQRQESTVAAAATASACCVQGRGTAAAGAGHSLNRGGTQLLQGRDTAAAGAGHSLNRGGTQRPAPPKQVRPLSANEAKGYTGAPPPLHTPGPSAVAAPPADPPPLPPSPALPSSAADSAGRGPDRLRIQAARASSQIRRASPSRLDPSNGSPATALRSPEAGPAAHPGCSPVPG